MTAEAHGHREEHLLLDGFHEQYSVHLDKFDGPMDLLLHLIKKNELDICDISIAVITRQYLEFIRLMKDLNLEVAGDFLVMAATLLQIKSRQLLLRAIRKSRKWRRPIRVSNWCAGCWSISSTRRPEW